MLAKDNPNAKTTEALRSLRTSLLFKLSTKPRSKVVLITSAVPAQGKSFISSNLAYLLSAMGKRTLLIEADIRLASIKQYIKTLSRREATLSFIFLPKALIKFLSSDWLAYPEKR